LRISELAVKLTLKNLLIELTREGTKYAQLEKHHIENEYNKTPKLSQIYREGLEAISNVLASILPGVCSAQVQAGFHKFIEIEDRNPYSCIDEDDVEELLRCIHEVWRKPKEVERIEK